MTAKEFDKKFDENEEDIVEYLDLSTARRPNLEAKSININFPLWMIKTLEKEARHIGISREAIIKAWLAEKINQLSYQQKQQTFI